jgi:histone H3/H4
MDMIETVQTISNSQSSLVASLRFSCAMAKVNLCEYLLFRMWDRVLPFARGKGWPLFQQGRIKVRRATLSLLVVIAVSAPGQAQMQESAKRTDYPFQCGAIFAILAKAYGQSGETAQAALYESKFDRLSRQAESEFEKIGRAKEEGRDYMQQHVTTLSLLIEKDASLVANFARRCSELFPS